jgi:hypothetical protein
MFENPIIKVHRFQDFAVYVPVSGHLLELFSELSKNSFFLFIYFFFCFFYDKIAGYNTVKKPNLSLPFSVFQVSTFVPYVMQLKSEMQARFTSVERILEYTEV